LNGAALQRRCAPPCLDRIDQDKQCALREATIDVEQGDSNSRFCDQSTTKIMGGPGLGRWRSAGRALWRGKAGRATEPPCEVSASRPIRVTITPAGLAVSESLRWRRRRCCGHECELQQEFDETQHCCRHAASALRRHRTQATTSALRA
jgi:hypothetical protein